MRKQWGYSMVKPIRNDEDLDEALARIEEIFDAEEGTPEDKELAVLLDLVEHYEDIHYPIAPPSPIAAIEFMMDQRGMTRRDLAPFIGNASKVSEVLSGKRDITMAMARALHKHLGIPADILLQDPSVSFDKDAVNLDWQRFPLKPISEWLRVESTRHLKDRAEEIVRTLMDRAGEQQVAATALFRKNDLQRVNAKADRYALTAWCWQVMAQANESPPSAEYRAGSVTPDSLREVAKLSQRTDGPRLAGEVLAEHGVALQIVSHLPRTYLDGAAMWVDGGHPVIGLTLRYDRIDNFWFTLLHELAHLARHLDGDKATVFYDDLSLRGPRTETAAVQDVEIEADKWAEDALVPPSDDWEMSLFHEVLSPIAVMELAQKYEVHPAVIAGRVRYDRHNYRLLSQFVGSGEIRKQFEEETKQSTAPG